MTTMPTHTVEGITCRGATTPGYVHVLPDGTWHCNRCGFTTAPDGDPLDLPDHQDSTIADLAADTLDSLQLGLGLNLPEMEETAQQAEALLIEALHLVRILHQNESDHGIVGEIDDATNVLHNTRYDLDPANAGAGR
jgi:hypothetical protein